jgi:hypothetical protein
MDNFRAPHAHMRSSWNETRMVMRGPLTDRAIARYQQAGWYSEEFRQARRDRMHRKAGVQRQGNWLTREDGQSIYSPK